MAALFVIEPPEGRAGAVVTGADDAGRWLLRRVSPQLSVVDHGLRSKCIELQLFDNNQTSFAPIWQISQAGQDDAATLGALLTQHETIKHLPTGRVGVLLNEATAVMTPDAAASATRTTNCFVSVRFKHGEPPCSVDRQSIVKATAEEAAAACLPQIWQNEHSVWQSEHSDDSASDYENDGSDAGSCSESDSSSVSEMSADELARLSLPDPKPAIETSQPLLHAERAVWQRVQDAVCLLHQIVSLLSPSDLGRATAVCRDWRAAGQNDELWSRYFDTQLGLAAKLKSRQPLQTWFQLYSQNKLAQLQLHSCPPDTGIGKAPARDGFLLGIEICRGRQQGNTTLFSSVQEINIAREACDRLIQLQDINIFEPGALSFDNVLVTVLLIRKVDGKIVTLLDRADGEGDDFSDNDDELRWSISSYVSIPDSRPKDPLTRDLLPASHSACAEFDTALLIERVPRCNCAGAYDVEEPMCVPEFSSRSVLLYLAMYALKMIRVRS